MRSLRSLNLLLIALVLAPTSVLAALSLQASSGYRAEVGARLRRELSEAEGTVRLLARQVLDEDRARGEQRVRSAADVIAQRLPLEPVWRVFADARGPEVEAPLQGKPGWFQALWTPEGLDFRVMDPTGRTLLPAIYEPDAQPPPSAERERLLEALRRESDAALFGKGDVIAAQQVWTNARGRFTSDALKALAEVEQAWVMARGLNNPPVLSLAMGRLRDAWPEAVLDGVGRTWVLLLLTVADRTTQAAFGRIDEREAMRALARLERSGQLAEIPLTPRERERLLALLRGGASLPDRGGHDTWTAPLPAGLTLELRRLLPRARETATLLLREIGRRWPAGRPEPLTLIAPPEWAVALAPRGDDARVIDLPMPADLSASVLLRHPEASRLDGMLAVRRRWTLSGIAALLVLVAVGLYLSARALAREREATRLKDEFLANVSHELRTPLTAVCLHADLLAEPDLADERRWAHAQVVRAEGARLAAMVDDLLDFAALQSGSRRLEIEPVDLRAAVAHGVDPFRVLAEREGVELQVAAEGEAIALADPHALARVLANLVGNAWKHGRPSRDGAPGRIRLEVAGPRVTVRDDGPGIPASERGRLFERFQRGAAAAKTRGVGLGLALSRDLARAMGGNLVVVEDPGATVFRLTLPPVPPMPPLPPEPSGSAT